MVRWLAATLSPATSARMDVHCFNTRALLVEEDMKGQFPLVESKDDAPRPARLVPAEVREHGDQDQSRLCLGNAAAGDVAIYPSLASVRSVALRRFPGSTRSLFDPALECLPAS